MRSHCASSTRVVPAKLKTPLLGPHTSQQAQSPSPSYPTPFLPCMGRTNSSRGEEIRSRDTWLSLTPIAFCSLLMLLPR